MRVVSVFLSNSQQKREWTVFPENVELFCPKTLDSGWTRACGSRRPPAESYYGRQCYRAVRGTQLDADRLIVPTIKSLICPRRHQHSPLLFAGKLLFING